MFPKIVKTLVFFTVAYALSKNVRFALISTVIFVLVIGAFKKEGFLAQQIELEKFNGNCPDITMPTACFNETNCPGGYGCKADPEKQGMKMCLQNCSSENQLWDAQGRCKPLEPIPNGADEATIKKQNPNGNKRYSCRGNGDCPSGWWCQNGKCVQGCPSNYQTRNDYGYCNPLLAPTPPNSLSCSSNNDCPNKWWCNRGTCAQSCPSNVQYRNSSGYCNPGQNVPPCASFAFESNGRCYEKCVNNDQARNSAGNCICRSDDDCKSGKQCLGGLCQNK